MSIFGNERDEEIYRQYLQTLDKHREDGTLKGLSKRFLVEETMQRQPTKWYMDYPTFYHIILKMSKSRKKK